MTPINKKERLVNVCSVCGSDLVPARLGSREHSLRSLFPPQPLSLSLTLEISVQVPTTEPTTVSGGSWVSFLRATVQVGSHCMLRVA